MPSSPLSEYLCRSQATQSRWPQMGCHVAGVGAWSQWPSSWRAAALPWKNPSLVRLGPLTVVGPGFSRLEDPGGWMFYLVTSETWFAVNDSDTGCRVRFILPLACPKALVLTLAAPCINYRSFNKCWCLDHTPRRCDLNGMGLVSGMGFLKASQVI